VLAIASQYFFLLFRMFHHSIPPFSATMSRPAFFLFRFPLRRKLFPTLKFFLMIFIFRHLFPQVIPTTIQVVQKLYLLCICLFWTHRGASVPRDPEVPPGFFLRSLGIPPMRRGPVGPPRTPFLHVGGGEEGRLGPSPPPPSPGPIRVMPKAGNF